MEKKQEKKHVSKSKRNLEESLPEYSQDSTLSLQAEKFPENSPCFPRFTSHSNSAPSTKKSKNSPTSGNSTPDLEESHSMQINLSSSAHSSSVQDILAQNQRLISEVALLKSQLASAESKLKFVYKENKNHTSPTAEKKGAAAKIANFFYGISKKAGSFMKVFRYTLDDHGAKIPNTFVWLPGKLEDIARPVSGESTCSETGLVKKWSAWRVNEELGGSLVSGTYSSEYVDELAEEKEECKEQ